MGMQKKAPRLNGANREGDHGGLLPLLKALLKTNEKVSLNVVKGEFLFK